MRQIDLDEYNYDLPGERIAQYPAEERDGSRLLIYRDKKIEDDRFIEIDNYLPEGSLLVFNNTRVIKARLIFYKESGARIEVFCLEPLSPADYAVSLASKYPVEWKCLIGNVKKWKEGVIRASFKKDGKEELLKAEKINTEGEAWRIRFTWESDNLSFGDVIEASGHVPLPPYVNRQDVPGDTERYQTIYSSVKGSVAAPTAGFHFTKEVLSGLAGRDIKSVALTLHVGAGTFLPIKSDNIYAHQMHSEHFYISADTIGMLAKNTGSIIAVGTTSVRTIESLHWLGIKLTENPSIRPDELYLDQWEPYSLKNLIHPMQSLETILRWMETNKLEFLHAPTRIIIIPGYNFSLTNGIITNFHQPMSTLLLLVSAWVGNDWKKIYSYALEKRFRFLSYGDSSLLLR